MESRNDYRSILIGELEERIRRNPGYSLRAFARDLGLQASKLSEALNRKCGISGSMATQIATRLGFGSRQTEHFVALVEKEHARSKVAKQSAAQRLERLALKFSTREIELESFRVIADWYHYAILDLTQLKDFQHSPEWIAQKLSISPLQAQQALQRLRKASLLVLGEDGRWKASDAFIATPNDVPSQALKQYHSQMIKKAEHSLHFDSVQEREIATLTMAIDPSKMAEAKEMLREFRRKFCRTLENKSESKEAVYALTLQFFPLTPGQRKENQK